MNNIQLDKIIDQVAQQQQLSRELIENQLINFLDQKYLNCINFEQKLIESGKNKIIHLLFSAQNQQIGNGYYGWHVPSYKDLLYQFSMLDAAEKMHFETICDELLVDELIYTKLLHGDDQPTTVGLTKKGIIFFASKQVFR